MLSISRELEEQNVENSPEKIISHPDYEDIKASLTIT